ncbi:Hypothetical predicted protein [Mytilus galloprovincialis]|uniref:Uncharacterized protein n=1 Tax=Mytilus galloprovincialis TaxID=29158 RepID=A0A8B6HJP5_MYTGA|nr:Hypothetical predicted protein [Mytilus galloprovincialis]
MKDLVDKSQLIGSRRQAPNLKKLSTRAQFSTQKVAEIQKCGDPRCGTCEMLEVGQKYSGEQKERENYFRFSLVTTEIINYAYQKLIEMELKRKSISLEEFINLNQHRIQHMSINKSCCQCTSKAVIQETNICAIVLQTPEMKVLFDDQKKRRPGHSEQEHNTYCCCYAKSGIQLSSLTTKIANILLNFCTHDQEIIIVVKQLQEVVDEFNYTTSSANLTNVEYQYNYSSIALDALKKIGMYCHKEDEINLKLQDVQRFILYRNKLETLRLEKVSIIALYTSNMFLTLVG